MKKLEVRLQQCGQGRFEVFGRAGRIGMVLGGRGVWSAEAGKAQLGTAPTRGGAVQMVALKAAVDGKL